MAEITKTIVPAGLYTDPGPFSAAPEGALVEAQNVVLLREGLLEPRPGFTLQADSGVSQYDIVSHGTYVEDVGEFVWYNSGFSGWTVRRDATDTITGPTDFTHGKINAQYVKGRLLFTSNEGVCEMPQDSADTIAYRAGLPQPFMTLAYAQPVTATSSQPGWLADGESVAYRLVAGRRRGDGTLMLSAPTGMIVIRNDSGYDARVEFDAIGPTGVNHKLYYVNSTFDTLLSTDFVFVYRGPKIASLTETPGDEMRLRTVIELGSDLAFSFTDYLDDDTWSGAALYTNSTQEGILQSSYRPDYARDICLYNNMTMYAGERPRVRAIVTIAEIGGDSGTFKSQGITGNVTTGSATITGVSATHIAYCIVGQVLTHGSGIIGQADSRFPADTYITAVGATTLTVSAAALSTAAATSLRVWDWLSVTDSTSGNTVRLAPAHDDYSTYSALPEYVDIFWQELAGTSPAERWQPGYQDFEIKFNSHPDRPSNLVVHAIGETQLKGITLSFEKVDWDDGDITIKSTRPLIIGTTSGGEINYTTGVTFSAEAERPARLWISKNDIPDAIPLGNYIDIGNLSSAIIRVIPAQNTCLVFKEDGLYQVFGNDPSSLSVEQLDLSAQPVPYSEAGNWITARGSTVFMMSKNGPLAVTDSGTVSIGAPVMETFREMFGGGFRKAVGRLSSGTSNNSPYVLFSYNELSTQDGGLSFVFNVENGTWTTWTQRRAITSHWLGEDGNLMIALGAGEEAPSSPRGISGPVYGYVNVDRGQTDTRIGFDSIEDNYLSATSTSLGDSLYDFGYTFGQPLFRPKVGDIIKDPYDSNFGVVVSADNNSFTAYILSGTFDVGPVAVEVREAYPVRVTFAPSAFGAPGIEKEILKVSYAFNQRAFLLGFSAEFETYRLNSDGEQEAETLQLIPSWGAGETEAEREQTMLWAPDFISLDVPRSVASDWATKIGFSITQAGIWFSLGALVLKANVSSDLVNRGRS